MIISWIDTETTGLKNDIHDIIQFGAYRVELDAATREFYFLDKHEFKIKSNRMHLAEQQALKINHYTELGWRDAISQKEACFLIRGLFNNSSMIAGHNLFFDLSFIKKMFERNKQKVWFPPYIDTKHMASQVNENSSLDFMCKLYNISYEGLAHTAVADCERSHKLYLKLEQTANVYPFTFKEPYVHVRNKEKKNATSLYGTKEVIA
jgi:DNA polymerase III alpha subunit (gram-positive type)